MPQTEPTCRVCDRHRLPIRCACDLQQELVLLRLQPRFYRSTFAEVKKLTQLITELS